MHRSVTSSEAPAAIGPYSQAVVHGDLLWCSGQLGLDPVTGVLVPGGTVAEARRALANLDALCATAGTNLRHALRCTIYLVDLADFAAVNAVYAEVLTEPFPARATVQVAALPKGGRVEIDAVVAMPTRNRG